jgi:hypothetical protein
VGEDGKPASKAIALLYEGPQGNAWSTLKRTWMAA